LKVIQGFFEKVRRSVLDMWAKIDGRDRFRYLVIAGIALVLIIGSVLMLNSGKYTVLASKLDVESLAQHTTVLDENRIRYKLSDNGTIMVNKADHPKANGVLVQSENIDMDEMKNEGVEYSIYQLGVGIMNTEGDKRFFEQRQTEANLRDILMTFKSVKNAKVALTFPDNKKAVYADDFKDPTASVTLWFEADADKSDPVVLSVVDLISKAADIKPENISIVDENMRKLNEWKEEDNDDTAEHLNFRYDFERRYEKEMADSIIRLLSPVVGSERVTAFVKAELDWDDKETEGLTFMPVVDDEGIPRSMNRVNEEALGSGNPQGAPGVDENAGGDVYDEEETNPESYYKNVSETINYEVSQLAEKITQQKGKLVNITAAVSVDQNVFNPDIPGNEGAADDPINNEDVIRRIVGGSLGLTPAQYANNVQVTISPFRGLEEERNALDAYNSTLRRSELFSLLQNILLYLLVAACIILLGWRTLALFRPPPIEIPEEAVAMGDFAEYEELVDLSTQSAELELTKSPSRERVEEFINSNPEAVAGMLRNWLSEEGEFGW